MKKFLQSLQFIFKPSYWLMNENYSKEYDQALNALMNDHEFKYYDEFTTIIGGYQIWIENHPYASFVPYENGRINIRASRLTIKNAMKKYKRDMEKQNTEKYWWSNNQTI